MSRAAITPHLHIYEKSATANEDWRKQIYRCKDPHCKHYQQAEYIEGKEISCFKCKEPFVVGKPQLWKKNKQLVCVMCSKSPKKVAITLGKNVMNDIFKEFTEEERDPILAEIEKES